MRVLLPLKKGLTTASGNKSESTLSQPQQQQGEGRTSPSGTKSLEAFDLQESQEDSAKFDSVYCANDNYLEQENEHLATAATTTAEPWTPKTEPDNLHFTEDNNSGGTPSLHESISSDALVGDESLVLSPPHNNNTEPLYAERQKRKSSSGGSDSAKHLKKQRPTPFDNGKKPAFATAPFRMAGGRQKSDDDRRISSNYSDSQVAATSVVGENEYYENDPASALGDPQSGVIQVQCESELDEEFCRALKKRGLEIREQEGDGNCLFRAVSLQVYGDPSMHFEVRQQCLDFMSKDEEHFSQFVTDEPFAAYIRRKRQDGVHGNNPEIQAISELFNRPVEVFVPENGAAPLNIFHAEYKTADAPIRLSYHDGNHYNAVVDPLVPTAGLGLGLPGLQLGLADKLQVAKAVAESDKLADQMDMERALEDSQNDQLQRAIKESTLSMDYMYKNKAIALSDVDATNFELEQAVLESSLETFKHCEQGRKPSSTATGKRRRPGRASPPSQGFDSGGEGTNSQVASLPSNEVDRNIPAAASAPFAVASVAARAPENPSSSLVGSVDEYPQTVQELVMNGFDLRKVVHAYELIGDNFDDLLAFLMQGPHHHS